MENFLVGMEEQSISFGDFIFILKTNKYERVRSKNQNI